MNSYSRARIATVDWQILLGLALLPAALLAPFLAGLKVLYYRDLALVFQPQLSFITTCLLGGQMPLWNPLLAGGFPQWASMEPSFLYPLNVLFGLPFPTAWSAGLYLHLVMAAWGTFALGRLLRWHRAAASLAALSYSLGGFAISLNSLYTSLQFVAWLPIVHLTFQRLCRRPVRREWLLAAAALGWQTTTNRPEFSLMTILFLGTYALYLGSKQDKEYWGREAIWRPLVPVLRLGILAAAALAINAATIVPAVEFIRSSNRQIGVPLQEATLYSFPPLAMLQFVIPQFFGDPEWAMDWGRYFVGESSLEFSQLYPSVYAGMGAYLLACYALAVRRPLVPLLASWAILSLLLALGRWGFLFTWFHSLPLLSLIRYPAKFLLLWTWGLVLLTGLGTDTWLRRPEQGRRYFTGAFILGLLALAVLAAMTLTTSRWGPWLGRLDWSAWTTGPLTPDQFQHLQRLLPRLAGRMTAACLLPLLFLTVMAGLASMISRRTGGFPNPRSVLLLLLAIMALDLLLHSRLLLFGAAPDFYQFASQSAEFIKSREPPRSFFRLHQIQEPFQQDLRSFLRWTPRNSISWLNSLDLWAQDILASLTVLKYGLPSTQGSPSSLMPAHSIYYLLDNFASFWDSNPRSQVPLVVAGLMNVKYIQFIRVPPPGKPLSEPPWARHNPRLRLLLRNERTGVLLYENRTCRPRAFFVPEAVVVPSLSAAARLLASPHLAWHHRVVLTADPALQQTLTIRAARRGRMPAVQPRCQILEYRNQFVRVAFASPESGYLVLSDNYYPGWSVTVDAQPRPLLQANAVVRAVWVEAGTHDVVFRYRPRSWWIGTGITVAVAMALLLAGPFRATWARRAAP